MKVQPNVHTDYPSLSAAELTAEARLTLIRILRTAFPHPNIPDGPYLRTADKIAAEAAGSIWLSIELVQGLAGISAAADGRRFEDLTTDDALTLLRRIEGTVFFGLIRRTTVLNFYDDPEVWEALGYEGASYDQGGYINRGFNDLQWLPEPRIEEAEEQMPEVGALPYPLDIAAPPLSAAGVAAPGTAGRGTTEGAVPAAAAAAGPDELSGVGPSSGFARREARGE